MAPLLSVTTILKPADTFAVRFRTTPEYVPVCTAFGGKSRNPVRVRAPESALANVAAGTAKLRFWDSVLVQALMPNSSPREPINAPPLRSEERRVGNECK